VQELVAFLNQFYLDHSCRIGWRKHTGNDKDCGNVHLMAMGHSYGALIDFHSLISKIEEGLNVDQCHRVYGFGDLTVLLNPAFEGARYRPVFRTAASRPTRVRSYFGEGKPDAACNKVHTGSQIPTVVTLQSLGDSATGTLFPLLMGLTTPFSQTISRQENLDKDHAIGWDPAFRTHTLKFNRTPGATDSCPAAQDGIKSYCPFQSATIATDPVTATGMTPLTLSLAPGGSQPMTIRDYFPPLVRRGRQGNHGKPRRFLESPYY